MYDKQVRLAIEDMIRAKVAVARIQAEILAMDVSAATKWIGSVWTTNAYNDILEVIDLLKEIEDGSKFAKPNGKPEAAPELCRLKDAAGKAKHAIEGLNTALTAQYHAEHQDSSKVQIDEATAQVIRSRIDKMGSLADWIESDIEKLACPDRSLSWRHEKDYCN